MPEQLEPGSVHILASSSLKTRSAEGGTRHNALSNDGAWECTGWPVRPRVSPCPLWCLHLTGQVAQEG